MFNNNPEKQMMPDFHPEPPLWKDKNAEDLDEDIISEFNDPDLGHLEAAHISEESKLQEAQDTIEQKEEEKERKRIEAREEDRRDIEDTYRRF